MGSSIAQLPHTVTPPPPPLPTWAACSSSMWYSGMVLAWYAAATCTSTAAFAMIAGTAYGTDCNTLPVTLLPNVA